MHTFALKTFSYKALSAFTSRDGHHLDVPSDGWIYF